MNKNQPYTPITNAIYTYDVKYPNGSINPTERKVITRNLCVDSLFRKNYKSTSSTDFVYTLPDPITNVISMNVSAIEFPYVWYTFSSENRSNEFTITIYNSPHGTSGSSVPKTKHVIVIPEGNYRSDLLVNAINNIFINIKNGLEFIQFDIDERSTLSIFRTKTSNDGSTIPQAYLNDSLPPNFYFELDFTVSSDVTRPLYKNAGWMLGFRHRTYKVTRLSNPIRNIIDAVSPQTYNWYLTSESSYGSSLSTYIYLEIDDFNNNFTPNMILANVSSTTHIGKNIVGRISITSGINTIITNTNSDCVFKKRDYFGPVKLDKLRIRILDKFGVPIDLNENDYSFVLEIEQLYS